MQMCPNYFHDFDPAGKTHTHPPMRKAQKKYILSLTRYAFIYFLFCSTEKVIKVCGTDGQWFRHPESNRVWTNYTQCQAYTKDKLKVTHNNVVSVNTRC